VIRDESDVSALYDAHADFVWRCLHRLDIHTADLPDLLQEVFVVVHRRRAERDLRASPRGLVWSVAVGLARNYRRRASRRRERLPSQMPERRDGSSPERELLRAREREHGRRLLDQLDPEKRAVFVMFEVEGASGREIAASLGLPLGTVHSRLHAARRELRRGLEQEAAVRRAIRRRRRRRRRACLRDGRVIRRPRMQGASRRRRTAQGTRCGAWDP